MEQRISKLIIFILATFNLLHGVGSYEILNFPKDSRSLSLHNAASAYDRDELRNNPASLSMDAKKIVYSYLILPAGIYSGEIQRVRKFGSSIYAGKLSYISYGAIIDGKINKKTSAYDMIWEIAVKKEMGNIVSIGISGGYLMSYISGYHSQLLYTNIGIRSRMMKKRIGLGFSLENIGFHLNSYTDVKEPIPTIIRSAIYYIPKHLPVIVSFDIIRSLNRDATKLSGSLEFNLGKQLTFRVGCSSNRIDFLTGGGSGINNPELRSNLLADISGGAGFQFNKMNLDVGFMNLGAAGYVVGFSISKKID